MYLLKAMSTKTNLGWTGFFAPFKRFRLALERRFGNNCRDAYHRTLRSAMTITDFCQRFLVSLSSLDWCLLGQDFFPSVDAGIFRMHVAGGQA